MQKRTTEILPAGTRVRVTDPNYKTETVGDLREQLSTGHYYEGIKLTVGSDGRASVSGYIERA